MRSMDAIVIAGGIPGEGDPLYPYTQGGSKALLDICGKPMIQWVIDALEQAEGVGQVLIIGLPEGTDLQGEKISTYLSNQGGILENIRYGVEKLLERNPSASHALVVSSDIPALTPESIDWVVDTALQTDDDVYYNVITRQVMEARFPTSNRSYVKLKGLELCGGDMNVIRSSMVTGNNELWQRIIDARKNALKQASLIGYDTLFLLLIRAVDLDGAVKKVSRRLGLKGRALLCPYAEIGMDVDKPHQLEILRNDLSVRSGQA